MSVCIGFGEREDRCENTAGGHRSPLWCVDCDKARIASIDASMAAITAKFDSAASDKEQGRS